MSALEAYDHVPAVRLHDRTRSALRSQFAQRQLLMAEGSAARAEALSALGLSSQDSILLLCNGQGGIVARLAGRNIDPREIQPALQKLLTR